MRGPRSDIDTRVTHARDGAQTDHPGVRVRYHSGWAGRLRRLQALSNEVIGVIQALKVSMRLLRGTAIAALTAVSTFAIAAPAPAVTEIQFWHAMDGTLGKKLDQLVERFNASQPKYRVVATYKGSYDETLALGIAASLQGKGPNILQVYEVGTASMTTAHNLYKPAYQILARAGEKLSDKAFVAPVASSFSDQKGKLLALPFNVSTPVLYYNRDAFKKAGIAQDAPMRTWYDLQAAALKIYAAQATPCGITTTWPGWIMMENVLARHNEEFATRNNGFDGPDAKLSFNTLLAMRHVALISSWVKAKLFEYSGRRDEGEKRFVSGDCAILTSSSASYSKIQRGAAFRFGVAPLPYYDDFKGAPYHTLMGGAGLWAMAGKKPAEDRGVAKFFAYLAKPDVQAEWSQDTGYLPASLAAYELTRSEGFYDRNPGTDVGVKELLYSGNPTVLWRGIRLGNHAYIRGILDEELESVWLGTKLPKPALDEAVARGNEVLDRFAASLKKPAKPSAK
jgi:sn-glycerol 3-phosphate transport system substrate-binding protein